MNIEYTNNKALGISKSHRVLLTRLHLAYSAPFGIDEAVSTLKLPRKRVRTLLPYWTARGWLSRIRRGLYITVPLNSNNPSEFREDPWIVANSIFSPCYIGGWSAAEHWELTEQIFSVVVVFTSSMVHNRRPLIKGTKYNVITVSDNNFFSLSSVWRKNTKVSVSSPSKTIADILSVPRIGGGIRHVAEIIVEYFSGEHRDDEELRACLKSLNNRTAIKRLGYIIEALEIDSDDMLMFCADNISSGYSRLDPTVRENGRLLRRWNLEINVNLKKGLSSR